MERGRPARPPPRLEAPRRSPRNRPIAVGGRSSSRRRRQSVAPASVPQQPSPPTTAVRNAPLSTSWRGSAEGRGEMRVPARLIVLKEPPMERGRPARPPPRLEAPRPSPRNSPIAVAPLVESPQETTRCARTPYQKQLPASTHKHHSHLPLRRAERVGVRSPSPHQPSVRSPRHVVERVGRRPG